jgi:hypothetical protein
MAPPGWRARPPPGAGRPPVADTDAPKGTNVFTRHIGPLPMWAWVAIIAVPLLVYGLYSKNKAAASTSAASTGTTASTTGAAQVPQFVNQTYTSTTPPAAPVMPKSARPQQGRPHPGTGNTSTTTPPATTTTTTSPPSSGGTFSLSPGSSQSGPVPTSAIYAGQSLGQVLAALQKQGYGVSSVSYAYQNLPGSAISQYYSTPVYSLTTSGNTVAIGLE